MHEAEHLLVLACGFLIADISVSGLERVSEPGEIVYVKEGIPVRTGGHPGNVSVDLAKLGMVGAEIGVIGNVGNDLFGTYIENVLVSRGIRTILKRSESGTTKDVNLVVRGQDRRHHVDLGASWEIDPKDVLLAIEENHPLVFYLASGILGKVDDEAEEILKAAKSAGSLTFLDTVQPYGKGWDFIVPALRWVDVFHCNDYEAMQITGQTDWVKATDKIISDGTKLLLMTMDSRGAVAKTINCVLGQPGFRVEVVDPTGAGDAFCAGVISTLIRQYRETLRRIDLSTLSRPVLSELLLKGQAVAAVKCTGVGTTEAVSHERTLALIRTQGDVVRRSETYSP